MPMPASTRAIAPQDVCSADCEAAIRPSSRSNRRAARIVRPRRSVWMACTSLLAILCLASYLARANDVARRNYFIAPQALSSALKEFAAQSHMQLIFSESDVGHAETAGVRGQLSPRKALAAILAGTNLEFEITPDQVIVVRKADVTRAGANSTQPPSAPAPPTAKPGAKEGKTASSDGFRVAQTDQAQTEGSAAVAQLQEVVVTAQKRKERLIDVPESVSVVSGSTLEQNGATQFRDYASTVPGLSFNTSGAGHTEITLRGVTTGVEDVSSTVGVYIDDVQVGSSSAYARGSDLALDAALVDLDQIEVLRGPQGTLYGASTMGGLIKYETRSPNLVSSSADIYTGAASTADGGMSYNEAVVVNAPLVTDEVGLRASGFYNHDGGYINDIGLGQKDANRADIYGGRVGLLAKPVSKLSIRVDAFLQDIRRDGTNEADFEQDGVPTYGPLLQSRKVPEPFDQNFNLFSVDVTYDFGFAQLTSVSSYQYMASQTVLDVSPLYSSILSSLGYDYSGVGVTYDISTRKVTQEVRLASPTTDSIVSWLVGAYFTHENSNQPQGFSLRDADGNPVPDTIYSTTSPSTYREVAGFGDVTVDLTRKLSVTGGLRYADITQELAQQTSGIFGTSSSDVRSQEDKITYLADAKYEVNDHVVPYLRFATGYRPGGANAVGINPATGQPLAPPSFQSDSLRSYEAGLKAETADGSLAVDTAVYDIDWTNFQVVTSRNGFGVILNAPGGAIIRGAELSLQGRPSDEVVASGAFAYQDAYLSADAPDLGGSEGERLPNVPRFTANVALDYTLRSLSWNPTAGISFNYVSDKFASFDNSTSYPQFAIPSRTTVDLRAGADIASVHVNLYVHNMLDHRGEYSADTTVVPLGQPAQVSIQQPRTIGLSLSTHF